MSKLTKIEVECQHTEQLSRRLSYWCGNLKMMAYNQCKIRRLLEKGKKIAYPTATQAGRTEVGVRKTVFFVLTVNGEKWIALKVDRIRQVA